jgi:hypothetical protein
MLKRIFIAFLKYRPRKFLVMALLNNEEKSILAFERKNFFLNETGWLLSNKNKKICDKNGHPLPWLTYSFIYFIQNRINNKMDVFEFGCGSSTLYWGERVKSVTSVEHDYDWFFKTEKIMPNNCKLFHRQRDNDEYSNFISELNSEYDMIIIDGRDRVKSCLNSIPYLKKNGVIIFDNFERVKYHTVIKELTEKGYRQLDFWGIQPISHSHSCTTIFYKTENCLGI